MIFAHFLTEVNEANAFVVGCEETSAALLVDVPLWDPRIAEYLRARHLTLEAIFITHGHYDHVGGLAEAVRAFPATVYSGVSDIDGVPAQKVRQGDTLRFGHLSGTVFETPGHTPDSVSLALPGLVFAGDALFSGSVGGTSSARDAKRQIDHLRQNILTLPDDCQIHTGHGPSSTVYIEKRYNPFLV
jgi:glyoxylase-like metal-dependent hydrolase (beta-lactamase superfamily II)